MTETVPRGGESSVAVPTQAADLRRGWVAVFVFMLLYGLAYLDRQVINLLVDDIRADLGVTDVQIGILQGFAFVLSFALCALPFGWAVDRYPRRWIVFVGVVFWSLSASATGLARTYWHVLFARLGVGAGEAALAPAAYSTLSDIFPKDRLAFPMAVFSSGAIVGAAVSLAGGGLLVGWAREQGELVAPLIGVIRPWQFVFLLAGAPGLVLAGLVFLISEPARNLAERARTRRPGGLMAQLGRHKGFYACHFLGFCVLGLVAAGWSNWAPAFMSRSLGWPVTRVGLVLGGLGLVGGLAGMLGSGALADRLFRSGVRDAHFRIYAVGACALTVLGVVLGLVDSIWIKCACILAIGCIHSFIAVAATALQIVTPARMRGLMSTVFLFFYNIVAYGIGPLSIAFFTEYVFKDPAKISYSVACHFGIFAPIAGLIFLIGLGPMRRAVESIAP